MKVFSIYRQKIPSDYSVVSKAAAAAEETVEEDGKTGTTTLRK